MAAIRGGGGGKGMPGGVAGGGGGGWGGGGGGSSAWQGRTKNFFDLEILGKYTFGELDLNQVAFMVHSKQFEDSLLFPRMSRIQAA